MPTYEYECTSCGHVFDELILSAADEESLRCPACGSTSPQKRITACAGVGVAGSVAGPACPAAAGFG